MSNSVENFRGVVTSLRELIIIGVLLLFLFLPNVMSNVLTRAGFTQADIAGFKWELQHSVEQTQTATKNASQLEEKLSALSTRLDQVAQSTSSTPEVKQEINTVAREVAQTRQEAITVNQKLQNSLAVQQKVIKRVDPQLLQK